VRIWQCTNPKETRLDLKNDPDSGRRAARNGAFEPMTTKSGPTIGRWNLSRAFVYRFLFPQLASIPFSLSIDLFLPMVRSLGNSSRYSPRNCYLTVLGVPPPPPNWSFTANRGLHHFLNSLKVLKSIRHLPIFGIGCVLYSIHHSK